MEWLDIILLIEMISGEVFSSKKGSTDRGKMYESIQEFLNPNKTKAWTLRQFKEWMREEEEPMALCKELSEKDTLIEELTEQERSF